MGVALLSLGGASSTALYRGAVGLVLPTGAWGVVSEGAVLALVAVFVSTAVRLRGRITALARLVVGGVGAVAAYVLSELVKLFIREDRPCRAVLDLAHCPAPGDWSYPSNHAVIAVGLAVACLLAVRRAVRLVVPLAAVVAVARVAEGVHYPHDVAGSVLLAGAVVFAAVALLAPATAQAAYRARRWAVVRRVLGVASSPVRPRR